MEKRTVGVARYRIDSIVRVHMYNIYTREQRAHVHSRVKEEPLLTIANNNVI